jgi:modulator of FtsH protease HflK
MKNLVPKRLAHLGLLLLALWFASGFFIVRGNEQAVVRRFGRARHPALASGLHYDWPWPLGRVDRVNVHEMRTLAIGIPAGDLPEQDALLGQGFLKTASPDLQGEFLTGDKNILSLQVTVQFRVADAYVYLTACESPENGLSLLTESAVSAALARSGVDFVHPLGLVELREHLLGEIAKDAQQKSWGLLVEDANIASVLPPVEVKAAFLDVSNARAEKDRLISQEQARGEKMISAARAAAQQRQELALAERNSRVETAKGAADRFTNVVGEFDRQAAISGRPRQEVRRLAMQRAFYATLDEVLPRLAGKVLLDAEKPFDLTIFPPESPPGEKLGPGKNSPAKKSR